MIRNKLVEELLFENENDRIFQKSVFLGGMKNSDESGSDFHK
jgi:hypothetical protein